MKILVNENGYGTAYIEDNKDTYEAKLAFIDQREGILGVTLSNVVKTNRAGETRSCTKCAHRKVCEFYGNMSDMKYCHLFDRNTEDFWKGLNNNERS